MADVPCGAGIHRILSQVYGMVADALNEPRNEYKIKVMLRLEGVVFHAPGDLFNHVVVQLVEFTIARLELASEGNVLVGKGAYAVVEQAQRRGKKRVYQMGFRKLGFLEKPLGSA